jgi:nitrogen-specific signal transduction histidine kinase
LALTAVLGGTLGLVGPVRSAAASGSSKSSTPLRAPKTSDAQDTEFLTEVAEADAALASYEQKQENVALRALLTDGSAFCALLKREANLDEALVEEATGARSTESQTHLPLSVTTFNAIEGVSLLTLCPSEQKLLPSSVRTKIRSLGKTLVQHPG